tara:strand:- start:223 stop:432 length:210 start_codon:yes stop_codon:yes gene_type:complete
VKIKKEPKQKTKGASNNSKRLSGLKRKKIKEIVKKIIELTSAGKYTFFIGNSLSISCMVMNYILDTRTL